MASRVTHPRRPGHARRRPKAALHRRGPRPNPNPPPSLPSRVRRRACLLPGQSPARFDPRRIEIARLRRVSPARRRGIPRRR